MEDGQYLGTAQGRNLKRNALSSTGKGHRYVTCPHLLASVAVEAGEGGHIGGMGR